jgi:hypothetical protein
LTPAHEQVVNVLLKNFFRQTHKHVQVIRYPTGSSRSSIIPKPSPNTTQQAPEPTDEQLRESELAKCLIAIAEYAEGYPYPYQGDVRNAVNLVLQMMLGISMVQNYFVPPKFHTFPLGKLINEALLRFYRLEKPGQLLTITEVRKRFNVTRQTVHDWVEAGKLWAVRDESGKTLYYAKNVERLQEDRARVQHDKNLPEFIKRLN